MSTAQGDAALAARDTAATVRLGFRVQGFGAQSAARDTAATLSIGFRVMAHEQKV